MTGVKCNASHVQSLANAVSWEKVLIIEINLGHKSNNQLFPFFGYVLCNGIYIYIISL